MFKFKRVNVIICIKKKRKKEWMTTILFVTKKDTPLHAMDGCNSGGEINRLPLNNRMPKIGLPKK